MKENLKNIPFPKEILNLVFAKNLFLMNKPNVVWVLSEKNELNKSIIFEFYNGEYKDKHCIDIKESSPFILIFMQ